MCVFSFAIFFSSTFTYYNYQLSPMWYLNLKGRHLESSIHQFHVDPVITDLDGDGMNEIVVITNEMELAILSVDSTNIESFQPEALARTKISEFAMSKVR
jgi:hypothetical protein